MMTQCITAAVLFGTGDILAQQAVEGRGGKHDVSKVYNLAFCVVRCHVASFVVVVVVKSPDSLVGWLVDFR